MWDQNRSPKHDYSLGRKDNDGNYEPGNVHWEVREQQENNKRDNRVVEVDGVRMTIAQAARKYRIAKPTLIHRLDAQGMSVSAALRESVRPNGGHGKGVITTPKLTPAEVEEIRHLFAAGMHKKALAEKFKVSAAAVRCIVIGKAWPNVGGPVIKKSKRDEAIHEGENTMLTEAITTKFSDEEAARLRARAQEAGVPLRTYIRHCVVEAVEMPLEAALVLAELGRLRELLTRLWSASCAPGLDARGVFEIAADVAAIEDRVLVRQKVSVKR